MGKIKLEILLENEIFYTGEVVGGKLKLTIEDELKVTAITINLRSHAKVMWAEGTEITYMYIGNETYLDKTKALLKVEHGQKDAILPPGTHDYPFKFLLPKYLPGSFMGDIGHVGHKLKARVYRPMAIDRRCNRVLKVVNLLDLNKINKIQHINNTVQKENSKNLCCWWCKSDPIIATMVVKNRRGYVPGEAILFSSEITNMSGRTIRKTKCKLIMEIQYHAVSKTCVDRKVVAKAKQCEIKTEGSDILVDGKLEIPPLPPSFLEYCNIIDINYFAEMQVVPAGPAISLEVPVEVIIGTIPLKETAYLSWRPLNNTSHTTFAESARGRKSRKTMTTKPHPEPQTLPRSTHTLNGRNRIHPVTSQ